MHQRVSTRFRRDVKRERRKYGCKRGMDNPRPARIIPTNSVRAKEGCVNGLSIEQRIQLVLPQVQNRKDGKSIWIPVDFFDLCRSNTTVEILATDTIATARGRWYNFLINGVCK